MFLKYTSIFIIFFALVFIGFKVQANQKLTPEFISCMQNAVEKRDTSISVGFSEFSQKIIKSLEVRKESIKSSWALESMDDRDNARKLAWEEYKKIVTEAKQDLKNNRNKSWDLFKIEKKSCEGKYDSTV